MRFIVPRQRKEFFQDDLFPPTRSVTRAALTAAEWSEGKTAEPVLESVAPAGMGLLSAAPPVEKEKKPSSAYFLAKADEHKSQTNDAETIKGERGMGFGFGLVCDVVWWKKTTCSRR